MDCMICNSVQHIRYTICGACYDGAIKLIAMKNKLDPNKAVTFSSQNSSKGVANVLKWVEQMKAPEDDLLREKLDFLGGFVVTLKDQIHTDVYVKPGNNGRPIPAHRALLAARSSIFRDMLDMDGNVAPPNETITFPELNYEELECLLEFLYQGHLPKEKVVKHVYALAMAADKYEITFLQKFCEKQMLKSLTTDNVLEVLDISDTCSNQSLKEDALNFIVKNMGEVVFPASFDSFALKNPHLTVQITRAYCMAINSGRNGEDKEGIIKVKPFNFGF